MSFSTSFEKLRKQPKQQQQQQGLAFYIILSFARLIEGRAGGERPSLQSPSPPHPGKAAYIFVDPIFNMSANDDAGSERNGARLDNDAANFVYTGQENVPDGVIHVRIHPSIKVIRAKAFLRQSRLISVELHDGLEVIEKDAFCDCRSLREILFPPSVRAIKDWAFHKCSGLTTAILKDGLEEIGEYAFSGCALVRIDIPPSMRAIKDWAFSDCSG
jgi:hypothetical protein